MLDELGIAYDEDTIMSQADATRFWKESGKTEVALYNATRLFFSFKVPVSKWIHLSADTSYKTVEEMKKKRKADCEDDPPYNEDAGGDEPALNGTTPEAKSVKKAHSKR